jgi:predicted dehydrogenase
MSNDIRWGVLSTAHIAQAAFLPGIKVAGGRAHAVAGRDRDRTDSFARSNGIEHVLVGYERLIESPDIEAIYNPLPNSLHAEWTIKALVAGKAVLCEKPLCGSLGQTAAVLEVARRAPKPLWEAFVFPFHRQQRRLQELVTSGAIGQLREIHSEFFFKLRTRQNIRLAPDLAGGALNDVGCYPLRFAQLTFPAVPKLGTAVARWSPEGVDEEARGVLEYEGDAMQGVPGARHLVFACGMTRDSGTFTRLLGDEGEVRITNPFHARADSSIEIRTNGEVAVERLGTEEPTFAEAIRHIHAVLRQDAAPLHTALDDSLATETALDLLHRSARSGTVETAA